MQEQMATQNFELTNLPQTLDVFTFGVGLTAGPLISLAGVFGVDRPVAVIGLAVVAALAVAAVLFAGKLAEVVSPHPN